MHNSFEFINSVSSLTHVLTNQFYLKKLSITKAQKIKTARRNQSNMAPEAKTEAALKLISIRIFHDVMQKKSQRW